MAILDNDVAQLLARLGIQNAQITLDGDELSHDQLRSLASGRGTYKTVIEACANVIQAGIQLMVRVNMNRLKPTGLQACWMTCLPLA
jgi:uncharacterized protein